MIVLFPVGIYKYRSNLLKGEILPIEYLFNSTDRFALINHLDGDNWEGSLPYTVLVAPGGEVLYRVEGQFEPMTLKKKIVGYLGRTYFD